MVGTQLEEFGAEVLGVMRDVSPGRDMILCRLTGCNLEHAGIIQGMSGSPIYVEGKLLGAVAYAWEFAKDPIAGITPFEQMVKYVRSTERRVAAEGLDGVGRIRTSGGTRIPLLIESDEPPQQAASLFGGMRAISTPIAASGFGPRTLAWLSDRLHPMGMAAAPGGSASEDIVEREGDKPLVPGSPISVAMVTGDFNLSGIGTVTHVQGERVYAFGHPMFGLGSCEFPMMSGYIHTVYPRASVSMKMGSPLKIVGVLDADVSTGIAGRLGQGPDLLPMEVRVRVGRYAEPTTYRVRIVREPTLMPSLVMAVLNNSIDTEGNLPEELTARIQVRISCDGQDPLLIDDTYSGGRYGGATGSAALFQEVGRLVQILARNPIAPSKITSITCKVEIDMGRTSADLVSVRLDSDRIEPGQTLHAIVTLKPYKGERQTVSIELPTPVDLPEGTYELSVCDQGNSLRRRIRSNPELAEPKNLAELFRYLRMQSSTKRSEFYLHLPLPDRGLAVEGQAMPALPGSARAVLSSGKHGADPAIRAELIAGSSTPFVVEGAQSIRFTTVRDAGLSHAGSD
ncbi:MAG: SpoIVB peptidase S55 domain-containing protein [Isosphaeraceae bacterium]